MSDTGRNSWQAVRDEVLRRIQARIWAPGALLPTEMALATEFGCARTTVNRALRELAETGLLDRRRKAGTRVALHPVRRATLDIPVIRLDVEARGQMYRHSVVLQDMAVPGRDVRAAMGTGNNAELLHLQTLHMADGGPYAFEDRWINPAAVPAVLQADFGAISANEWLVLNAGFTHGDIAFSARNATADEAEVLGTDIGMALFVLDRTTWRDGVAITSVRQCFAPGHRLHTDL